MVEDVSELMNYGSPNQCLIANVIGEKEKGIKVAEMVTLQNKENTILRPHLLRQTNVKKCLYSTSKNKSHKKMSGHCSCHTILCWYFI